MSKKIIALILSIAALCSVFTVSAMAADYTTKYKAFSQPSTSGDYAYWNGSKVVRASGTTVSEVKWMQAALNYCIVNKGLSATKLDVDGSFGPASKKATTAFQKKYGLSADGSFGPATIKKMISVLSEPTSQANNDWLWPSPSRRTTCGFADNYYHTSHWHRGIDISCSNGTNVYAAKSGTIACVGSDSSRGKYMIIDHGNGYYSEYQHLSSTLKSKGNYVAQGDVIARSGNTGVGGYHLHFEIWNLGSAGRNISNANVPWNSYSQYVNVNPKNQNKVYCTKGSGFTIRQKQGSGIATANLQKTNVSAGSGVVYCFDNYGINYIFK